VADDAELVAAQQYWREWAAMLSSLAEDTDEFLRTTADVLDQAAKRYSEGSSGGDTGPMIVITGEAAAKLHATFVELSTQMDARNQLIRLNQWATAEQAAALERLREAGGTANPAAVADYEASIGFIDELLARPEVDDQAG
jgi:hypothetical protein